MIIKLTQYTFCHQKVGFGPPNFLLFTPTPSHFGGGSTNFSFWITCKLALDDYINSSPRTREMARTGDQGQHLATAGKL